MLAGMPAALCCVVHSSSKMAVIDITSRYSLMFIINTLRYGTSDISNISVQAHKTQVCLPLAFSTIFINKLNNVLTISHVKRCELTISSCFSSVKPVTRYFLHSLLSRTMPHWISF